MPSDPVLDQAIELATRAQADRALMPQVASFFDEPTNTASHVVADPRTRQCAIIDSVLDFDVASGRTGTSAADTLADHVIREQLTVQWVLETHVHADHFSAAPYLQQRLGGQLAIGAGILIVQNIFGKVFNEGSDFRRDGSQFDRLFKDGDAFRIGDIPALALHTPGHTPACMTYLIGGVAFVGDTLFMPDYGSARADFPGGDARLLYRSMRRVLSLPRATTLYLCHDYKAPGRTEYVWQTTVGEERERNVHMHDGVTEEDFVHMRTLRDANLGMPKLILPSVQVNMRAGQMPPAEADGVSYLKIPLNKL